MTLQRQFACTTPASCACPTNRPWALVAYDPIGFERVQEVIGVDGVVDNLGDQLEEIFTRPS